MSTNDVEGTLEMTIRKFGLEKVRVPLRPRLLSDNGPIYLSKELKLFFNCKNVDHIRVAPHDPGQDRVLSSLILERCYAAALLHPSHLWEAIAYFVNCYNNQCYQESLENKIPADVFMEENRRIN
jgi:transposase InsO family protein